MRLIVKSGGPQAYEEWRSLFAEISPGIEVLDWFNPPADLSGIEYALVWAPDAGRLAELPDLKLIVSSGVGVDHILDDPQLPAHLPIARLLLDVTAIEMGEYVLMSVMMLVRDMKRMIINQANRHWEDFFPPRRSTTTRVGIMGLGSLGAVTADLLGRVGFRVSGWSRRRADLPGVRCHAGEQELDAFLAETDILVCLLPATDATRGVLNARTFAGLPRGACLVNAARGSHMVQADLLAALDSGQIRQAVLDVFEPEPLAADSPLWTHPGVIVTPHIASTPSRRDRAVRAAELVGMHHRGEPLPNLYDRARGY
ncbi:glyoxylate/hydroxypyruvate reductase A [Bordetella sp. FB-8]|uniref:2-hydroxyacid dehydrogenase n=1 Tax=Bordetella sp. FB-8 TaxID=1159870 RepID=UPI000373E4DF|nr:glyoxylate/hydroxypyruvate reductase A [Bordetella sp. FB-8]